MSLFVGKLADVGQRFHELLRARLSWAVVVVLLVIQAIIELRGGAPQLPGLFRELGLSYEEFQIWQPLTYAFLHGNLAHAAINCACLLMLGARLEHMLGARAVWRVWILGAVGGGVGHLALTRPDAVLVGSSGAALALLMLATTLSPESRMWPVMLSARAVGFLVMAASGLLALMDPAAGFPGFSKLGVWLSGHGSDAWWLISHGCHFGGGVTGWLFGRWLLRPRVNRMDLLKDRRRREKRREEGRS